MSKQVRIQRTKIEITELILAELLGWADEDCPLSDSCLGDCFQNVIRE